MWDVICNIIYEERICERYIQTLWLCLRHFRISRTWPIIHFRHWRCEKASIAHATQRRTCRSWRRSRHRRRCLSTSRAQRTTSRPSPVVRRASPWPPRSNVVFQSDAPPPCVRRWRCSGCVKVGQLWDHARRSHWNPVVLSLSSFLSFDDSVMDERLMERRTREKIVFVFEVRHIENRIPSLPFRRRKTSHLTIISVNNFRRPVRNSDSAR